MVGLEVASVGVSGAQRQDRGADPVGVGGSGSQGGRRRPNDRGVTVDRLPPADRRNGPDERRRLLERTRRERHRVVAAERQGALRVEQRHIRLDEHLERTGPHPRPLGRETKDLVEG